MKKIILFLALLIFIIGCAKQIEKPVEISEKKEMPTAPEKIINETPAEKVEGLEKTEAEETPATAKEDVEETQTNWPTFHGDSARTGFSASKSPSTPNVLWKWAFDDFMKIDYDGNFEGNWPIIDDGKVFIAPESIFALDLKTGEKIWAYTEEGRRFFPRGLATGIGKLFISVNAGDNLRNLPPGYVYALDEKNGKFLVENGIGIDYGLVVSGKVGSRTGRLAFTTIGEAVNDASRLEAESKSGKHSKIMVSESVAREIESRVVLEASGILGSESEKEGIPFYEVCGIHPPEAFHP